MRLEPGDRPRTAAVEDRVPKSWCRLPRECARHLSGVPAHQIEIAPALRHRRIAQRIESELEYPGQVRVNVIREVRASEFAK